MNEERPILQLTVARDEVPPQGLKRRFNADAAQRAALARRYGLEAVESFEGEVELRPWRREGLAATGRVEAKVVQRCVVTLEPVDNAIGEDIDVRFDPEPGTAPVDAEDDPPEPMVAGRADIGRIVEEFFALGIDLYPRKPGVVFETGKAAGDEGADTDNPFRALDALRKGRKDG
ncbi:MAG: DUF177 domain-containing protein [Flavobacteriaceae bacterium]